MCSDEHRFLVAEQLREAGRHSAGILLEPVPRNTAPAIALATMQALKSDPEALLLVLPADHLIGDEESFRLAVEKAVPVARRHYMVTFGIRPDAPETGFGYIRRGKPLGDEAFLVEGFVEKPDADTAREYVDQGSYDWNSGMFLLPAALYLDELAAHAPDIAETARGAFESAHADLDFIRVERERFEQVPDDSIDYAVMERTRRAAVVPVSCAWSDIGYWAAYWSASERDPEGSHVQGDVIQLDNRNCLVTASERRLVATIGLEDLIIVDTPDVTLVARRDRVQDVKGLVGQLRDAGRSEHLFHRKVYRPWCSYDSIDMGERFQVKRISVKPGAALSLQKHHHRAKHWIVVSGTAEVTRDDEVFLVTENESTYLPLGALHRLRNPGKVELELIEVQSGSYLGEDDIVRIEDVNGRA